MQKEMTLIIGDFIEDNKKQIEFWQEDIAFNTKLKEKYKDNPKIIFNLEIIIRSEIRLIQRIVKRIERSQEIMKLKLSHRMS